MFICSFVDIKKPTYYKYINFLLSFIGIFFAYSKFIYVIRIKVQERRPENAGGRSKISRKTSR